MHAWPMGAKPPFPFMVWFASAWVSDLSDIAMILVAAPAWEWVHMWVQEDEDFDSQLFLDQDIAAL